MSEAPAGAVTGLPAVAQAREPAWVRNGSRATQQSYDQGLAFEQVLVEELSSSLTASVAPGGEEAEGALGEEGSASSQPGMSALAPQALAGAIMGDGGLGLAAQLTRGLTLPGSSAASVSGGSPALQAPSGASGESGA